MLADWRLAYINSVMTKGDHQGLSRLEAYADESAIGNVYQGHVLTPENEGSVAVHVATPTMDATRGVWFYGYWFSPELGTAVKDGEKVILKQLNDANVLYAYDHRDKFIGTVVPRDDDDLDDIETQHRNRYQRAQFVEHRIAKPRAAAAQADADAVWDEVGERLADAADNSPPNPAETLSALDDPERPDGASPRPVRDADSDDAVNGPAVTGPVHEVVRPTRRGRRPVGDDDAVQAPTEADVDDAADALAELFRSAHQQHPHDQQHDQQDEEEEEHHDVD